MECVRCLNCMCLSVLNLNDIDGIIVNLYYFAMKYQLLAIAVAAVKRLSPLYDGNW